MIAYDLIRLGQPCKGRCSFCSERTCTPRPLPAVLTDMENVPKPGNIYLGCGDSAAYPELLEFLRSLIFTDIRRIRMKTTGDVLLNEDLYQQVLSFGVVQYEVECLGSTAAAHDRITGIPGSFNTMSAVAKKIRSTHLKNFPIETPFLVISVPVCDANLQDLTAITKMLIEWQPDRVLFRSMGESSFSTVAMELQTCTAECIRNGLWPVLSGFPFCTIPGLEYFCEEVYNRQIHGSPVAACSGCVFEEECCLVPEAYTETFGDGEFDTIQWHRYQNEIRELASRVSMVDRVRSGEEAQGA